MKRTIVTFIVAILTMEGIAAQTINDDPSSPVWNRLRWAVETIGSIDHGSLDTIFTPSFLGAISKDELTEYFTSFGEETKGLSFERIEKSTDTTMTAVARTNIDGTWQRVSIRVESQPPHRITRISYNTAEDLNAPEINSWHALDAILNEFNSEVSVAVWGTKNSDQVVPLYKFHPDKILGIGSAFKLWVIGALAEEIKTGNLSWSDTIAIRNDWKSLPSGRMQRDSAGTKHSIAEYAKLMISISDNTATDHLINHLGRTRIESFMRQYCSNPNYNLPFLTTREFFQLKTATSDSLRNIYTLADSKGRYSLLQNNLKTMILMSDAELPENPTSIKEIEYFAKVNDLCKLMLHLDSIGSKTTMQPVHDALISKTGLRWNSERWPQVYYKGGSEPGVLNMTWLANRSDGQQFTLAMTWNDTEKLIDTDSAVSAAYALIKLLSRLE